MVFKSHFIASDRLDSNFDTKFDFYEVDGRIYFGELSFYHWRGMASFYPEEWNYKFGE